MKLVLNDIKWRGLKELTLVVYQTLICNYEMQVRAQCKQSTAAEATKPHEALLRKVIFKSEHKHEPTHQNLDFQTVCTLLVTSTVSVNKHTW